MGSIESVGKPDACPSGHHHHGQAHHSHLVTISVDGAPKSVHEGEYRVSHFKSVIGVPGDYELDQVIHGEFHPLDDRAEVQVKANDVFVSHVRRGGSS